MFDKDVDLPTLEQVLHRETLPPVCLYNFYIVMRDRLKMEKALDFYLDIQHHEQLWKCYAKSMQKQQQQQNSVENDLGEGLYPLHHNSFYTATVPPSPPLTTSTTLTAASPTISRKDIVDSAQSLLLTYIIPSAPKEMTHLLPNQLILELRKELEKTLRRGDDGSLLLLLLGDVKAYLLGLMQKYAYPKFLQLKVWGNITLYQQLGRLVLGLLSLLAAFTLALSLILLGYPQWTTHRFFVSFRLLSFFFFLYTKTIQQ